jgi:hypothetical protein
LRLGSHKLFFFFFCLGWPWSAVLPISAST